MLKDMVDSTGIMEKIGDLFSDETKDKFEKLEKGVDAADAIASTLDEIIELIDDIKESISDMKTEEFTNNTNDFINANNEYFTQLYNDNFDYHYNDADDANNKIEDILKNSTYFSKIKNIYNSAKQLSGDDGIYAIIKGKLEDIIGIVDSFDDIKEKVEALNEDDDKKAGFEDVIDGLYEAVEEAADDFTEDEFKKYIRLLDSCIQNLNTLTELSNSDASSYSDLNDADKGKMKAFVNTLMGIYYDDWNNSSLSASDRNEKLNDSIKKVYGLNTGLLGFGNFANSLSTAVDTMNDLIENFIKDSSSNADGFLDKLGNV